MNYVKSLKKSYNKEIVWLGVIIIGLSIIITQIQSFKPSLRILSHADLYWLIVAVIMMMLTYLSAAATYCLLAATKLSFYEEVLVQLATTFVNRLLPAGIGGIGANYGYLRHKKHSSAQAASIVATNNLMGIIGHLIIVILSLVLTSATSYKPNLGPAFIKTIEITGIIVLIIIFTILILDKNKVKTFINEFWQNIKSYRHRPFKTSFALLTQISLTIFNLYCLSYSLKSVGGSLSFVAILIVFTFSNGIRNITPTPGGLGGYEAGLVAAMVAYKISPAHALAAVILYRLISYFGPLISGLFVFIYAKQKGLFSYK